MGKYYANGYTTPAGINSKTEVKRIQAALGVKQDGVWGAQTQAAWSAQSQGNISMPKTQAAVSQQAQARPDYAVSGFTPPSGVTNRQMVRSIQANRLGIWNQAHLAHLRGQLERRLFLLIIGWKDL